jgi:hypothetical protein
MTDQPKKEKITPEMLNEMLVKKGMKPVLVNQGPKRTYVRIIPMPRKSGTKEQPKDSDSQE